MCAYSDNLLTEFGKSGRKVQIRLEPDGWLQGTQCERATVNNEDQGGSWKGTLS